MTQLVDMIRSVPETAVRIFLGAKVERNNGEVSVDLDGHTEVVEKEVFEKASAVARALHVRPRRVEFASDILELRHSAEDIFLEQIFGGEGLPRILFVPSGSSASAYYRAMLPADVMLDWKSAIAHFTHRIDLNKASRYDILWIQLLASPILTSIAKAAKEAGSLIVFDIDDRLDAIPDWNQAGAFYHTDKKQGDIRDIIALADVVTTSTKTLKASLDKVAKDVRVLPNMVPAMLWPAAHPPDPKLTRILWAGSRSHAGDLAMVAPALLDVLKVHAGKVRLTIFGEQIPEALMPVREFVDAKLPVDFEDYADALAEIGADFGIAPLVDNDFNRSKSAVKALEYGNAAYPMLLSPVGEYPEVVEAGLDAGIVADSGWKTAIEYMIAMPREERIAQGKACRKWVAENRCVIRSQARGWVEVANELVGRQKA